MYALHSAVLRLNRPMRDCLQMRPGSRISDGNALLSSIERLLALATGSA
jgi:hypothetical protein